MTNEEFKCWINGFLTLTSDDSFNLRQYKIIKNHTELVKAITGHLTSDILNFLVQLESMIHKQGFISISDFKDCVKFMQTN